MTIMIVLLDPLYESGATVQHPVILLIGTVSNQLVDHIEVYNQSTETCINWPVISSKFKVIFNLKPGANLISLKHGFYSKDLCYNLSLRQSQYIVQPLYIVSKGSDGCFQAPLDINNSPVAAAKRISVGVALLQTFTAMQLKSSRLGTNTFQLPLDSSSGLPVCRIFNSKYTSEEMYAMTDKELWRNIAREVMESPDIPDRYYSKFLAFLSCTHYNGSDWKSSWKHGDVISATKGHIALGKSQL